MISRSGAEEPGNEAKSPLTLELFAGTMETVYKFALRDWAALV